jgi:hypothetical protein
LNPAQGFAQRVYRNYTISLMSAPGLLQIKGPYHSQVLRSNSGYTPKIKLLACLEEASSLSPMSAIFIFRVQLWLKVKSYTTPAFRYYALFYNADLSGWGSN